MTINLPRKVIETDDEGFLVNPDDWNEQVAAILAKDEQVVMSETHWGLVGYIREFWDELKVHPTMQRVVTELGKNLGERFNEDNAYVKYLHELFPADPIRQLCKIAGLPKPVPTGQDG